MGTRRWTVGSAAAILVTVRAGPARAALLAAGVVWGCRDGLTPPASPRVARLEVFATDSSVLVGHTLQLQVTAWDSSAAVIASARIDWRSTDPGVLTVDSTGLVLGHAGGEGAVYAWAPPSTVADTLGVHVAVHGEVKWRLALGFMPLGGGPAQGPEGTVYVLGETDTLSNNATLYAVTPQGAIRWHRRLTQVNGGNYPFVATDGAVYVVGQHVWAFAPDGSLRWSLTTRPIEPVPDVPSSHAGAVGADGTVYAAMGYDLFAFRASTGDTLWQGPRASDAGWRLPPTVSTDGRTTYVKKSGDSLYAVAAATGTIRWATPDPDTSPDNFSYGVGPAVDGGRLLLPLAAQLQEVDTGGTPGLIGPRCGLGMSEAAVAPDGTLYLQYHSCYLQAYRPVNVQLWLAPIVPRWTWYGGPALAQGGVLYTAAVDGFYAEDVSPGGATVRWRYPRNPAERLVFVGAPLIGADGTVYTFTSCDYGRETQPCSDELIAFWEDKPVEPASPWPMWRHDARRSGQAGP
jgi:outer membrane protein assembly factor BamB